MEQELSIDLLKRLKLNDYTLLVSKPGTTFESRKIYEPVQINIHPEDLISHDKLDKNKLGIPADREALVIELLLAQDPPDRSLIGYVELPDDSLAADL